MSDLILYQKDIQFSESTEELIAEKLLSENLDFHDSDSTFGSHNLHAFPAKFPPQIPHKFIKYLTEENEIVLDPMMGSGTTLIEASHLNRSGIGFDIDPLSMMMSKVKIESSDKEKIRAEGSRIIQNSINNRDFNRNQLIENLHDYFNKETKKFVDYWFAKDTQIELFALINEIRQVKEVKIRKFLALVFSSIIITKNGGVSLAFDLAHTRPHRAKIVYDENGNLLLGHDKASKPTKREAFLTKHLSSPIEEFKSKLSKVVKNDNNDASNHLCSFGDSQHIPLRNACIDLIVTSPPYAANAIDYMRAHKFSLVWLKHDLHSLSKLRSDYIGAESISNFHFEKLPAYSNSVISKIREIDENRALVLTRYFSEMKRVMIEMYRVLKPGKTAIVVVGSSTMRGIDTHTESCLAEIGNEIGFIVPKIGVRNLDRNRRMMPVSKKKSNSQIQQRMQQEFVIGFLKPRGETNDFE